MSAALSRLAQAILLCKSNLVQNYLSQGDRADVVVTEQGLTGLCYASFWGEQEIVNLLLLHGANPNAILNDGTTALMKAIERGHAHIVIDLLQAGAEAGLKDNDGRDALAYAIDHGWPEIELIVRQTDPMLERDRQLADFLFGGVHYKEIQKFCESNFSYDFSKNLLLLILSEVVFGSPAFVNNQSIYQVNVLVYSWSIDEEIPANVQLSEGIMALIGATSDRINEINTNRFRLENYGAVFIQLVTSWLNTSATLGSGIFSMVHEVDKIWLTYTIPQNELFTLDLFPREQGRDMLFQGDCQ